MLIMLYFDQFYYYFSFNINWGYWIQKLSSDIVEWVRNNILSNYSEKCQWGRFN